MAILNAAASDTNMQCAEEITIMFPREKSFCGCQELTPMMKKNAIVCHTVMGHDGEERINREESVFRKREGGQMLIPDSKFRQSHFTHGSFHLENEGIVNSNESFGMFYNPNLFYK